jgi:type IV pilus assembly protein PilV
MQLIRNPVYPRSRGFTLLEVLVAMVVLSVGLLGLSGLQTSSLRNNHSAFMRSQATLAANDIFDRMRANRAVAVAGSYNISYAGSPGTVSCTTGCTAGDVAAMDVAEWRSYVERLPGGEGEIAVDAAGAAEIRVRWADARDSANKLEVITRSQI